MATVRAMLRPQIVLSVVDDMVAEFGGKGFAEEFCRRKSSPETGQDLRKLRPAKILSRRVPVRLRLLPAGR